MSAMSPSLRQLCPTIDATHPVADPVIDWIDRELVETFSKAGTKKAARGGNDLLELRQAFKNARPADLIGKFYRLLPRLNEHHFLLGYRIRRWLGANFEIRLSDPFERTAAQSYAISETRYSLVAAKCHFFEHAEVVIPFDDIRVEVTPRLEG